MKTGIHPAYHTITISCACGNSFQVGSTTDTDIRVEVCSHCHPLYTGKTNLIDTAGRLEKFHARQQKAQAHKDSLSAKTSAKAASAPAEEAPAAEEPAAKSK